jgi:ribonuclease P protein component
MSAKRSRLSRSSDFERVYRQGRSVASRFLVLYYFRQAEESPEGTPRLGLSVSKKLGGAVVRNRVKRLLREAFRACGESVAPGHDYVLIARPQLVELVEGPDKGAVAAAVRDVLARAGLLRDDGGRGS